MAALLTALSWPLIGRHLVPARPGALRLVPLRALLWLGLPIGMQMLLEFGAFAAIGLLMGWLGTVALAGHQIALNLASLTFMVPLGRRPGDRGPRGSSGGPGGSARRAARGRSGARGGRDIHGEHGRGLPGRPRPARAHVLGRAGGDRGRGRADPPCGHLPGLRRAAGGGERDSAGSRRHARSAAGERAGLLAVRDADLGRAGLHAGAGSGRALVGAGGRTGRGRALPAGARASPFGRRAEEGWCSPGTEPTFRPPRCATEIERAPWRSASSRSGSPDSC